MGFSNATIMGNLTRDPEKRATKTEHSVVSFSVAVNTGYGDREEVMFLDCEAWDKRGDSIAQHFEKGKPILVSGRLRQHNWEDKDGNKRSKIVLNVQEWSFVGGKSDGESRQPVASGSRRSTTPPRGMEEPIDESDIPF